MYNIIRATSKVAEGSSDDAGTNQAEVLNSGIDTGSVSEEKFSTSCANECALPLISSGGNPPSKYYKVW